MNKLCCLCHKNDAKECHKVSFYYYYENNPKAMTTKLCCVSCAKDMIQSKDNVLKK